MMISRADTMKILRLLCILCAFAMGFLTLVGTSEEDTKKDVTAETDLELDPVTASNTTNGVSIQAAGDECNTITIKDALDAVKDSIEDYDKLDVDKITLEYVVGTYDATWEPSSVEFFTCSLTITGDGDSPDDPAPISVAETVVYNGTGDLTAGELTDEQKAAINYYLNNRSQKFTYCVECDAVVDTLTSYSVTYTVDVGIKIKGKVGIGDLL